MVQIQARTQRQQRLLHAHQQQPCCYQHERGLWILHLWQCWVLMRRGARGGLWWWWWLWERG